MSIRETSIQTWHELVKNGNGRWPYSINDWGDHLNRQSVKLTWKLSNARMEVYMFLSWIRNRDVSADNRIGMTGRELNDALQSQSAHKRLSELSERGLVREGPIRECRITGRQSIEWIANPPSMYREPVPQPKRLSPIEERDLKIKALESEIRSLKQEILDLKGRDPQISFPGLEAGFDPRN